MTDMNPEPRTLPEPDSQPVPPPRGSVWARGLMMLIFAILIGMAQTILHALTVLQFVLMLLDKGKPNARIAEFGQTLGSWLSKAAQFQTARTETRPWPFEG